MDKLVGAAVHLCENYSVHSLIVLYYKNIYTPVRVLTEKKKKQNNSTQPYE